MDIFDFKDENEYADQMKTGALLNPRIDSTFKALFTQDTPESKGALHSFLEAATGLKITTVVLKPNDAPLLFDGQRRVSYDIQCTLDNNQIVNIEMQAFNQAYDYGMRAEHQVARLEVSGLAKGDSWQKAPKVYQISVLNFEYKNSDDEQRKSADNTGINHYCMRTEGGKVLSKLLNVIFIELPLVIKKEATIDTNTALENWAIFLKEADNPKKQDLIKQLISKEAGLMQAQQSLSSISANRDLWLDEYRYEVFERDRKSSIEASEKHGFDIGLKKGFEAGLQQGMQQGIQQGIQQGLQQGMQQGMQQGKMDTLKIVVQNLLKVNTLSVKDIASSTGLSVEEVERIAKGC